MLRNALVRLAMIGLLWTPLYAWHGNGHYSVAYIAQSYLIEHDPEALEWANSLLEPYKEMCGENLYPFVESATWPDKIRDADWNIMFNHHFVSHFWFDEGAKPYDYDKSPHANVVFAIEEHSNHLASNAEDRYGSSKSLMGKSISLRNLIHYVGDIHQPLHASERVTPNRLNGDEGGNLFIIDHYHNPSIDNLHFVWDHMFGPLENDIRTNLPAEKYQTIANLAESIMEENTMYDLQDQLQENKTPESWGLESNQIARDFAYNGLTEGQDLPQAYQEKGYQICRERVALGGYRLGMLISKIYQEAYGTNAPTYSA